MPGRTNFSESHVNSSHGRNHGRCRRRGVVLSRFDADGEVAVAEFGHVDRRQTTGSATPTEVRSADDLSHAGVWWRVFVEGSADYRFTTSLSKSRLEDLMERSVRSARVLDQRLPASTTLEPLIRRSIRGGRSRVAGRGDGGRKTRSGPVGVLRFDGQVRARPGDRFLPRRGTGVGIVDDDRNDCKTSLER